MKKHVQVWQHIQARLWRWHMQQKFNYIHLHNFMLIKTRVCHYIFWERSPLQKIIRNVHWMFVAWYHLCIVWKVSFFHPFPMYALWHCWRKLTLHFNSFLLYCNATCKASIEKCSQNEEGCRDASVKNHRN